MAYNYIKRKVRATIEYQIEMPDEFSDETIDFIRNEGTWCADNMIEELQEIIKQEGCLCQRVSFEVLPKRQKD